MCERSQKEFSTQSSNLLFYEKANERINILSQFDIKNSTAGGRSHGLIKYKDIKTKCLYCDGAEAEGRLELRPPVESSDLDEKVLPLHRRGTLVYL